MKKSIAQMIDDSPSQNKTPFINKGNEDDNQSGEPTSPFHSMDDREMNSSVFIIPKERNDEDGIMMVQMSDSAIQDLESNKNNDGDDDDDSTYSTLKVHQGTADFDYELRSVTHSKWEFGNIRRAIIKTCYLSIFAIFGAFVRIILAQLFGEECKNPGTVGWLKAGQPLCVTSDGDTSVAGGIIFADFPANLLGSFIMGLMQSTETMDLPKVIPIAWLSERNSFQSDSTIHFAVMTGFCGSLTTFSSWNSEMLMMILGQDSDRGSLIFRAILGYFIGVETCIASFILGKNIARYIFARVNPALHLEAAEMERIKKYGIYINSELGDFERRFLSGYNMAEYNMYIDPQCLQNLSKWKNSTEMSRRHGHPLLPLLTDVEYQTMVLDESLSDEQMVSAITAGWDIEALKNWVRVKKKIVLNEINAIPARDCKLIPAALLFFILSTTLFIGLVVMNSYDTYSVTYRTMIYSCLLAPLGAFVRWRLSKLNDRVQRFNWFPFGTFTANVIGSIFSASMIGLESYCYSYLSFWPMGTIRALKVGFAGSLSTVSTFVVEASGLLKSSNPLHGYIYILVTISTSALLGGLAFSFLNKQVDVYYN